MANGNGTTPSDLQVPGAPRSAGIPPSALSLPPQNLPAKLQGAPAIGNTKKVSMPSDEDLLRFFNRCKKEAFADRWIFERQWTRAIHYVNGRQWLAPYSRTEGWRDARIAKGVPRPVTQKAKEIDQAIRSMFAAIRFGVNVRPSSQKQESIVTAATADDLMPFLHDVHQMNSVMTEFDYSFVNLGNAILHTWFDPSATYGVVEVPYEECQSCHLQLTSDQIGEARGICPSCKKPGPFTPVMNPDGTPRTDERPQGRGMTTALSPLEVAWPLQYQLWDHVPFLIRMRWREKRYYEEHPALKDYVDKISWGRSSTERSLQIFQSLPYQNDLGNSRSYYEGTTTGTSDAEGVAEYELWHRPTAEHPDGFVMRVAGDSKPLVLHMEDDEGLPGELPYKDGKGNPLFTFAHAAYHHVGGRILGSGVHDPVIKKYDQINRIDSMIEMIIMRMAAPQWMLPKGAEVAWLGDAPGLPGLLLEWNSQIAGPNGRPERIAGMGVDASIVQWRKMLMEDIETITGTFDILRGQKPAGVEAFAAMQLLVERGEARFAQAFQARGEAYKHWANFALEIERQFGPNDRTISVLSPNRTYAYKTFQKADLKGDVVIVIEDGTYTPKTSLGQRAAIEHLSQLKVIDVANPETQYKILETFGQLAIMPGLNAHVQAALKKQSDFEQWINSPEAAKAVPTVDPTTGTPVMPPGYPLKWQPWYDPKIHRQEFLKWANSDKVRDLLVKFQPVEGLLTAHLMEIDVAIQEQMTGDLDPRGIAGLPPPGPGGPGAPSPGGAPSGTGGNPDVGGAGKAMANSNQNAGTLVNQPGGAAGPAVAA